MSVFAPDAAAPMFPRAVDEVVAPVPPEAIASIATVVGGEPHVGGFGIGIGGKAVDVAFVDRKARYAFVDRAALDDRLRDGSKQTGPDRRDRVGRAAREILQRAPEHVEARQLQIEGLADVGRRQRVAVDRAIEAQDRCADGVSAALHAVIGPLQTAQDVDLGTGQARRGVSHDLGIDETERGCGGAGARRHERPRRSRRKLTVIDADAPGADGMLSAVVRTPWRAGAETVATWAYVTLSVET